MVLKNKEDCSFSAFHGLFVPRAPRSGRRRGHFIKKVENSNSQLCPFELLASLANELLQDTRSSTALNDASKRHDQPATGDDVFRYKQGEENLLKVECVDEGRCKEIVSIPEFIASKSDDNCNLTESSYTGSDLTVQHYSGSLEKINHGLKPVIYNSQNSGDDCFSKVDTGSLISEMDVSVTDGFCRPEHSDDRKGRGLVINDIPSANDPARSEMEFLALINEDNNVEVPLHRDPVHNASTVRLGNDLKLGITDDDENFRKGVTDDDENCRKGFTDDDENLRKGIRDDENFRKGIRDDHENFRDDLILDCRDDDENFRNDLQVVIREDDGIFSRHNKPSTRPLTSSIRDDDEKFARGNNSSNRPRAFRHLSRGGARRIKNLLSSKCWKSSPKWKDCELSKVAFFDGGMNPLFRKRKIHHSRERYLRETLKRRKLSNRRLVVTSGGGFSSKRVFNSPENRMHVDKNDFASVFNEENEMPSPTIGQQTSFSSKDSHVKFCIKSFRIPELLIEVPETTTVGSLKRTVMETLTAVLGSSLHVGMLLHGKKVRDDNRTLLQTGMTSKENLDTLGFTLEPTVCTKNPIIPLSYDTSQLASRSAAPPVFNSAISDALPGPSPLISSGDNARGYHELASACADKLSDKKMPGSRALVSVAAPVSAYSCGMVPVNHRTRQPEHLQRRARRPFSVPEVEKLVQAVERFGTGRWRDVKLLYFETAEHRTYVDLKDKWKTLVHTAQIPPQQRRGEPVPQELLDRVLAAHAYWSLQQAKQQYTN